MNKLPLIPFLDPEQVDRAVADLRTAADKLPEWGWIQGRHENRDGVCAMGALNRHCIGSAVSREGTLAFDAPSIIAAVVFRRATGVDIALWNDYHANKMADVQFKLREAADTAEKEVTAWRARHAG